MISVRAFRVALVLIAALSGSLHAQEGGRYAPRSLQEYGPELIAVVVTAGYCADSQRTDYRESVERMKLRLQEQATERGQVFTVAGVAVDWSAEEGLRHLARLGQFDQVIVGGGWANLAGVELLGLPPAGELTVPQVLVLERTVRAGNRRMRVSGERLVRRVIGVDAIVRWASGGFQIN